MGRVGLLRRRFLGSVGFSILVAMVRKSLPAKVLRTWRIV